MKIQLSRSLYLLQTLIAKGLSFEALSLVDEYITAEMIDTVLY
ncbi:hypothetical protein Ct9H90mP29_07510 [bacterium]|nr:MAG: hypothetical protein Ct9H90mP29_07510 [bacterium]